MSPAARVLRPRRRAAAVTSDAATPLHAAPHPRVRKHDDESPASPSESPAAAAQQPRKRPRAASALAAALALGASPPPASDAAPAPPQPPPPVAAPDAPDASPAQQPASAAAAAFSTLTAATLPAALAALSARCPVMARLVARFGPPDALLAGALPPCGAGAFARLVRAVAGQQLNTKAAATIYARVVAACVAPGGGGEAGLTPARLLATPVDALRGAGLSGRKAEYVRSVAVAFSADGGGLTGGALAAQPDDEVVAALTAVRGVGVWTAQMYLIFGLCRADVLPYGDYAFAVAFRAAYGREGGRGGPAPSAAAAAKEKKDVPKRAELERRGAAWAPHRSLAAWYLWRSLDAGGA